MWRAYASLAGAENRRAFLRTLRAVVDPGGQTVSAHDRLYLACAADADHLGRPRPDHPGRHGHAAHEPIPGSRFEIIEGAGHFPHVEAPPGSPRC